MSINDTDGINFYKGFEIEKQYNEDTKMISVLKSIDVLMNDQRNNGDEKWDNDSVKDQNRYEILERLSPLEEFNTFHDYM